MGSQSKNNLAYIAGFLDGDGSLMIQIKKRKDGNKSRKRFMLTICFYQDTHHEKPLFWIRKVLGIGYVTKRNDGITELRINGYKQVSEILQKIIEFLKFKKKQAGAIIKSAKLLQKSNLDKSDYKKLVSYIILVQSENYVTRRKKTKEELLKILDLTP